MLLGSVGIGDTTAAGVGAGVPDNLTARYATSKPYETIAKRWTLIHARPATQVGCTAIETQHRGQPG